jgi:hypothetical protein
MLDNFFSDGITGFICFGITYVIVELVYKEVNEKTNFLNKKISIIILIVIALILLSGVIMGFIDYTRAMNKKEPIFAWEKNTSYAMFITYTEEGNMDEKKGIELTEYNGFGYSIKVCGEKVTCDKPVIVLPFGLGSYGISYTGTPITEKNKDLFGNE